MANDAHPWEVEWEVDRPLSPGGQGIVMVMRHKTESQRRAVLKRIIERWRDDSQARERLRQETETLTKLNSLGANVPAVYDSSLNHPTGEPFLLMEFIEGLRFDEWLETSAPTNPEQAVTITKKIAETIRLCHQNQIGHRDLKPANIVLKNGEASSPYVLDFGISFDSRQSVILTRKGEMFWNEFIILPECQDLAGGQRDLRSDITALAGIFFSCLTGKPPIILRDAQESSPHKRHEQLLRKAAKTTEQGERLVWFFDRAFAYRITDRFQNLDQFLEELGRFSGQASVESVNLFEQVDILDQTLRSVDRGVQVAALRQKYVGIREKVTREFLNRINSPNRIKGGMNIQEVGLPSLSVENRPAVPGADLLDAGAVQFFVIRRPHFKHSAVTVYVGFGVGMQIHMYATSFIAASDSLHKPRQALEWTKVAVVDEASSEISNDVLSVTVSDMESKLGREVRNLVREVGRA